MAPLAALFAPDAGTQRFDARGERNGVVLTHGRSLTYRGVTVIDLDCDRIIALRTYCDSAAFVLVPASTA